MSPYLIVGLGVGVVLGLMLWLRVHAFLALLSGAIFVSILSLGAVDAMPAVLVNFGSTAGKIGIVIAFAAIIGQCLLLSGAADRIVGANVAWLGERRAAPSLMGGGYVLAIPVFFDTVFYLLIPLARKLHLRTGMSYSLCLMALAAGAAATHALVPPTPGPLLVANALGVSLAHAIGLGIAISIPACIITYHFAKWLARKTPLVLQKSEQELALDLAHAGAERQVGEHQVQNLSLIASLVPIALPIVLIGIGESIKAFGDTYPTSSAVGNLQSFLLLLSNPALALGLATIVALLLLQQSRGMTARQLGTVVEDSLQSAGVIILITAAGGAFGAALKDTGIAEAIAAGFDLHAASASLLMLLAFVLASMLKIAQGSSTVAMIVGSGMIAAMVNISTLGFAPVYLSLAICSGSLVGSWMNDSGFWIFSKMGGLTELQTLRTWTPLFSVLGTVAFLIALLLSVVLPMK